MADDPLAAIGTTATDPLAHIGTAPKDDPLAHIGTDRPAPKGKKPGPSAIDRFEAVAGAPQRALQALETGSDIGHAFMHPEDATRLRSAVKDKVGLTGLESGALAGDDPFHKFARGVLDTGLDVVNDPLTFVPVGKAARLVGKAVPIVGELAGKGAEAIEHSKIGEWLSPEYKARHLTDEGRAAVSLAEHQGEDAARAVRDRGLAAVREHAGAIRQGVIPPQVRILFRDAKNVPEPKAGMKPQDVLHALNQDADAIKHEVYTSKLKDAGLLGSDSFIRGMGDTGPARFFKDATKVPEAQEALLAAKPRSSNPVLETLRGLTHAGNKAFLGVPIPHILNLTALTFLKYGLPTTAKGLVNAVKVATGHEGPALARDVEELRGLSADSKYGAIFDELGLTKLFGSEKAAQAFNVVTKPLQRASNALQNATLNPAETGLRAAALNAEKAAGNTGAAAARDIHTAYGTDASNKLTAAATDLAQPFAKFHLQTALGAGLGAMAKHPGRIQALAHEDQDTNAQGGPAAFHLNVPGLSTIRAVTNPVGYGESLLGPIGAAQGTYSPLTQLREGKWREAINTLAGRFVPEDEAIMALYALAARKKGKAGEDPLADLAASTLTGGYFQKQAAR